MEAWIKATIVVSVWIFVWVAFLIALFCLLEWSDRKRRLRNQRRLQIEKHNKALALQ
jgi:hypothetical protein